MNGFGPWHEHYTSIIPGRPETPINAVHAELARPALGCWARASGWFSWWYTGWLGCCLLCHFGICWHGTPLDYSQEGGSHALELAQWVSGSCSISDAKQCAELCEPYCYSEVLGNLDGTLPGLFVFCKQSLAQAWNQLEGTDRARASVTSFSLWHWTRDN